MGKIRASGKVHVSTEDGESIAIRALMGRIQLPNGQFVQPRRAFTPTAIAQSQTDADFIPAPADGLSAVRILWRKVMCDADTLVTFTSYPTGGPGVACDAPSPCASRGGFVDDTDYGVLQGQPGEAIKVTTGAGGNTYISAIYIEIPPDCFDLL